MKLRILTGINAKVLPNPIIDVFVMVYIYTCCCVTWRRFSCDSHTDCRDAFTFFILTRPGNNSDLLTATGKYTKWGGYVFYHIRCDMKTVRGWPKSWPHEVIFSQYFQRSVEHELRLKMRFAIWHKYMIIDVWFPHEIQIRCALFVTIL